jgi:hypothetical protein
MRVFQGFVFHFLEPNRAMGLQTRLAELRECKEDRSHFPAFMLASPYRVAGPGKLLPDIFI